jgi:hypothetical protein
MDVPTRSLLIVGTGQDVKPRSKIFLGRNIKSLNVSWTLTRLYLAMSLVDQQG